MTEPLKNSRRIKMKAISVEKIPNEISNELNATRSKPIDIPIAKKNIKKKIKRERDIYFYTY